MNNFLKTTISSLLTVSITAAGSGIFSPMTASAAGNPSLTSASEAAGAAKTELQSENIKFEYLSTSYNGAPQKPKITVNSGGRTLAEDTDFSVQYPEDCVNSGLKTVTVTGIGSYSGKFSATYRIDPMNISDPEVKFTAKANACTYNGFSQCPKFQLTANGVQIPETDYSKSWSNNVKATESAVCTFTFSGNFTGKRSAEFTIAKARHDDLDIEIPVELAAGGTYRFTYDLSRLLPDGAGCGTPVYSPWDFPKGNPTVAFNELQCTVCDGVESAVVSVPVINSNDFGTFSVNFYFKNSSKIRPEIFTKTVVHEYDGKPVTEKDVKNSGCYASVNGQTISGRWIFWKELSAEPHTAVPVSCTFEPDDPAYESVDFVVFVAVNKNPAPEITLRLNHEQVSIGDEPILTVTGVPNELLELLEIDCSPRAELFSFEEYPSKSSPKFKLSLPYENGIYKITVSLPEDAHRFAAAAAAEINVGRYVPPEEQVTDKVTTQEELAVLIRGAAVNSLVAAQGMRSLSGTNLQAAAQKRLTLEIKLNDSYSWILRTSKVPADAGSLNLELGTAAIPTVLTDKIGGTAANSFTVSEKNFADFADLRITLNGTNRDSFASLFYYSSSGELEFMSSSKIASNKTVILPINRSGKFVVITDDETKLIGDLDNNGIINVMDVMAVIDAALASEPPRELYKYDFNNDGIVNIIDAVQCLTAALK